MGNELYDEDDEEEDEDGKDGDYSYRGGRGGGGGGGGDGQGGSVSGGRGGRDGESLALGFGMAPPPLASPSSGNTLKSVDLNHSNGARNGTINSSEISNGSNGYYTGAYQVPLLDTASTDLRSGGGGYRQLRGPREGRGGKGRGGDGDRNGIRNGNHGNRNRFNGHLEDLGAGRMPVWWW